ncbi:hypothetical protein ANCDUO_22294, partial [Ancylostoma duodenale]
KLLQNRNIIPSRKEVGWRGTTRYGSLIAHKRQIDQSFKSHWFFRTSVDGTTWKAGSTCLSKSQEEAYHGDWLQVATLFLEISGMPFNRNVLDRAQVYAAKLSARQGDGRIQFLSDTPPQYNMLLTWIDALVFEDTPPYSKFYNILEAVGPEFSYRFSGVE